MKNIILLIQLFLDHNSLRLNKKSLLKKGTPSTPKEFQVLIFKMMANITADLATIKLFNSI